MDVVPKEISKTHKLGDAICLVGHGVPGEQAPQCRRCTVCGEWINTWNADSKCPPDPKRCEHCGEAIRGGYLMLAGNICLHPACENGWRISGELGALKKQIESLLSEHWLFSMVCDHASKKDTAICSCGKWSSGPTPNVGSAASRWAEHATKFIMAELDHAISDVKVLVRDNAFEEAALIADKHLPESGHVHVPGAVSCPTTISVEIRRLKDSPIAHRRILSIVGARQKLAEHIILCDLCLSEIDIQSRQWFEVLHAEGGTCDTRRKLREQLKEVEKAG